jgi:hypothetical protein
MIPAGINKFKTAVFSDETFLFVEKNGKIEEMISLRKDCEKRTFTIKKNWTWIYNL